MKISYLMQHYSKSEDDENVVIPDCSGAIDASFLLGEREGRTLYHFFFFFPTETN